MSMTNVEREAVPRKTCVVFFLIGTSTSMAGTRIGAVNSAMEQILEKLRKMNADSSDAEIEVALLEFSSGARWLTPNGSVKVDDFYWNDLDADGTHDMGEAFKMLEEKLYKNSGFMQSASRSYAPVILLLSDSEPTDDYKPHLVKLKDNKWFKISLKFALAVGDSADENILIEFTGSKEAAVRVPDGINAGEKLAKIVHFISVTSSQVEEDDYYPLYYTTKTKQEQLEEALKPINNWSIGFSCSHNKQLLQALQKAQSELGEIVLTDPHKFKNVIADLLPSRENKTIRKRAVEAVELDIYARLQKASKIDGLEKERLRCIKLLKEDGIDEKLATEIVGAFAMLFVDADDDGWEDWS